MKPQEYFSDKSLQKITSEPKITGELTLQDYPHLEEIDLKNHQLTSLTITNCPNLKKINLRNNQLTKLELNQIPQLEQIIAGKNELTTLDLSNCPNLKELILPDNPYLTEIKGLNWTSLKNINIGNTSVNLAAEIEGLKLKNQNLIQIVKETKEAQEEGKLILPTQIITTTEQADEAIQKLLAKTEKNWREYLANSENALPAFQLPETRREIKKVLIEIIGAQTSGDYKGLVRKWNSGEKYNAERDFDCSSLSELMELVKEREKLAQQNLITV